MDQVTQEAVGKEQPFNVDTDPTCLDPNVLRLQICELWISKQLTEMHMAAAQGFAQVAEPLEALLTILEDCTVIRKAVDLKRRILLEFQKWMQDNPQVTLCSLSEGRAMSLQRRALELVTDRLPSIVNPLIDIYQLKSMDPASLRKHIAELKALNCHCEAAVISVKMEMQHALDMEDMCIPLILQDKLSLAEAFVAGHPPLERRLATLLDSWCDPQFTLETVTSLYPAVLSKNHIDLLRPKILSKHVFRLMGKFNVDPVLCPHSVHQRKRGTLRFLMEKRFVQKDIDEENWSDHTKAIVADDPEMQIYLEAILPNYCNARYAACWSQKFSTPIDGHASQEWKERQGVLPNKLVAWTMPQHCSDRFYQLPIARDNVHFLDTMEDLHKCRDVMFKDGSTVGVDMEWRAGFGCVMQQHVALIQLAVSQQVFILDMCAGVFGQHQDTIDLMTTLLSDTKVRKLGYDLAGDLKYLQTTWSMPEPFQTANVLDLHTVHQKIKHVKSRRSAEKGLSHLVQHVLGKPLDKKEQLSYWERRPLHESQIRYAATDAFCLLEVYSALSREPSRYGLSAEKLSI